MEFEFYDSSDNVQNANSIKQINLKQSGSIGFRLPNNKSGKIKINFTNKYDAIPKITQFVSVSAGNVFDLIYVIEKLDVSGFTLHICNKDLINEIYGNFYFFVEPF